MCSFYPGNPENEVGGRMCAGRLRLLRGEFMKLLWPMLTLKVACAIMRKEFEMEMIHKRNIYTGIKG